MTLIEVIYFILIIYIVRLKSKSRLINMTDVKSRIGLDFKDQSIYEMPKE